jgi:hypothetical protein
MVTTQPPTKAKESAPNFEPAHPKVEHWYCWIPYAGVRYYTYEHRAMLVDPAEQQEIYLPEFPMPQEMSDTLVRL